MERIAIAYFLIGLMVVFGAGMIAYARYNSPQRKYARRQIREKEAHEALMAEKADKRV